MLAIKQWGLDGVGVALFSFPKLRPHLENIIPMPCATIGNQANYKLNPEDRYNTSHLVHPFFRVVSLCLWSYFVVLSYSVTSTWLSRLKNNISSPSTEQYIVQYIIYTIGQCTIPYWVRNMSTRTACNIYCAYKTLRLRRCYIPTWMERNMRVAPDCNILIFVEHAVYISP